MFMRGLEIAEILQNYNKSVFTLKDIAKITGKPRKYLSLLLSKNKMFKRIERGKYCLKEASIYVIASKPEDSSKKPSLFIRILESMFIA